MAFIVSREYNETRMNMEEIEITIAIKLTYLMGLLFNPILNHYIELYCVCTVCSIHP